MIVDNKIFYQRQKIVEDSFQTLSSSGFQKGTPETHAHG
jgi:hypothetical protein